MERAGERTRTPLLVVEGLCKSFSTKGLFQPARTVVAAHDVTFSIDRGEAVALVGESGSGKSTVARAIARLEPPDAGRILLGGDDVLTRERGSASRAYRRRVQMVFQDPFGSLNPVHDVMHHLARPLLRHGRAGRADVRARVIELLRTVGLEPAEDFIGRHPYELSGGQRQRVAIARTLAVEPEVLIADEPTSMLDVSIRMGILTLLADLKRERGLAVLLITHDLASARHLADRILVFHRGRLVEQGPAGAVVSRPAHPYTRSLVGAIATRRPAEAPAPHRAVRPVVPPGERGCPFAERCPDVFDRCLTEDPAPRPAGESVVRCHLHAPAEVGQGIPDPTLAPAAPGAGAQTT